MAMTNYITNCNMFLVENTGNAGYFYEPEYYTTFSCAQQKKKQWEAIGDHAKIICIEVTARVLTIVNADWNGCINSLYDLVGVKGITVEEINACLNPNSEIEMLMEDEEDEEDEELKDNHFFQWLTDGKQGGALGMLTHYAQ